MMECPNSIFIESKEDFDNRDSLLGDRIEEMETFGNEIIERNGEIENPSNVDGGREKEKIKSPDPVGERNGEIEIPSNVVGESEAFVEASKSLAIERKREMETPPVDDCCPICFGSFNIPCKTNCGHWFCASCILQFWNYRAALQRCKCPICCCFINKLTPEASSLIRQEEDVVEVLKSVKRYNRLFMGGALGLALKVLELPLFTRRMFRGLMDPDRLRFNYCTMRFFALLMSGLYNIGHFDFIPTGGLGVRRLFDFCAVGLVVILFLAGICRRWVLRRRVRLLAAAQP